MCEMSLAERIIEAVKKYPILYDISDPDHKSIRKKDKVWDEIGFELQEKGEDIKKKWRNLRDTYAKYLRGLRTKTGQVAKKNYTKWQWSQQMDFFRPYLSFCQTTSNIRNTYEEEEIAPKLEITEMMQKAVTSDVEDDELDEPSSPSATLNYQSDSQSVASIPSHTLSTRKSRTSRHRYQRKQQKEKNENLSSVAAMVNYFENKRARYDKAPTDLIFSGYAQIVKSFSPKRQAITKMKIAQIIAEQELEHIEEMESLSRVV
ncbi:unnamed protein product [Callosobruchus maculatus]|uniref:MADF domain-containing protein n=1 Tax=Callosobruchus maculatus TaxID=64391 RepID=A0A653CIN0_CALMS|nr:unnamed protein product [Callosobruchus maculatus]